MADLALPIENNAYSIEAGSILAQLGLTEIANYLEDDWDDNSLTNRTSTNDGVFTHPTANEAGDILIGRYRPEWEIHQGTPVAQNSRLELSADDALKTSANGVIFSWSWTWQIVGGLNSSDDITFSIISKSDDLTGFSNSTTNGYRAYFGGGSSINFAVVVGGAASTIISGSWGEDTNQHSSSATRDAYGNFEYFFDGVSQGTATDTQLGSGDQSMMAFGFRDTAVNTATIDNLVVN